MAESGLTPAQEQVLREQVIDAERPGPILHDFGMLLDFMGPHGVKAAGKYNLLPIAELGELNQRLSRPIDLALKRPLLWSHPYIQGLNLLLRATGLSRLEGTGSKARLVLDPAILGRWQALNPTEQYFNLLEAWLRLGRPEMVGEKGSSWGAEPFLRDCWTAWQSIPPGGLRFDLKHPTHVYIHGIRRAFYLLALMDLFGLVEVERPTKPVKPWCPAGVRHLPFGDAVFSLLAREAFGFPFDKLLRGETSATAVLGELDERDQEPEDEEDDVAAETDEEEAEEAEEAEDGEDSEDRLGVWQPLFQPYFPQWRENLTLPEEGPRDGTFVFRVSLGKVWRLIAAPADATVEDLVRCILRSMKFDFDHLYDFTYRDARGRQAEVHHPYMDEGPWGDQVSLGSLPLQPGQTSTLLYDFGDSWRFDVRLERIDPPGKLQGPRVLEKHGEPPEQYPDAEDW
jgi:hypothetical protein